MIKGNIFQLEGLWYKSVPEEDKDESCLGCEFFDKRNLCGQITSTKFEGRMDLFCSHNDGIYKLVDIEKGKKKLLIL